MRRLGLTVLLGVLLFAIVPRLSMSLNILGSRGDQTFSPYAQPRRVGRLIRL
jgi:hypothetical protein